MSVCEIIMTNMAKLHINIDFLLTWMCHISKNHSLLEIQELRWVNAYRTSEMIKIYIKDEFKDAAKKDKLTLSDENENIAKSALLETSNNGALAALYKSNDVQSWPFQ